jgi:serine/threonine protein kinase
MLAESPEGLATLEAQARRRVGTWLRDKWYLERLVGLGAMAAVYASRHRNGSRGALKVLHPHIAAHASLRQRFQREGYVANRVAHPGAVKVLDDDQSGSAVFLVMELLEGETLAARIRGAGRLDAGEVARLADALLDVLAAAHDAAVVHRDVKPENVFLCAGGRLKVVDFGVARLRELGGQRTRTGSFMGTPHFMPPEQAFGRWEEVDARSDLWAVGATMFLALSGRHVHRGRTPNEVLLAAMTRPAPPLGEVAPEVPPALARVVDRALAFEPEDRWPDARTMQAALRMASTPPRPIAFTAPPVVARVSTPVDELPTLIAMRSPVSARRKARCALVAALALVAASALAIAIASAFLSG